MEEGPRCCSKKVLQTGLHSSRDLYRSEVSRSRTVRKLFLSSPAPRRDEWARRSKGFRSKYVSQVYPQHGTIALFLSSCESDSSSICELRRVVSSYRWIDRLSTPCFAFRRLTGRQSSSSRSDPTSRTFGYGIWNPFLRISFIWYQVRKYCQN
jgi:hypothetical protein